MARHASTGRRRGIAAWPLITGAVVLVLAAAVVGYIAVVGGADDADQEECTDRVTVPVAAAPLAAPSIAEAAAAFDATRPVARSACVTTTVSSVPDATAVRQLADDWEQSTAAAPGVWVAAAGADVAALEQTDSAMTAGRDLDPMATSPVVLAVRPATAPALQSLTWADLPDAATTDAAAATSNGENLVLALPDPRTNAATSAALQSVVLAARGGTDPVATDDVAAAGDRLGLLTSEVAEPATTAQALDALGAGSAEFTAVPVLAADLAAYNEQADDAARLVAVDPGGPTVGAEVFVVPLTAVWVDPTLKEASAAFVAFLRGDAGQQILADGGLATDPAAVGSAVVPAAGDDVDGALAAAIGA